MNGKTAIFFAACATLVCAVTSFNVGSGDVGDIMLERTKRQAPPPGGLRPWEEMHKCCPGIPMLIKNESKVGCFPPRSTTPPPPTAGGKPPMGNYSCWVECAFKKQSMVSAANVLDMTAIAARVAEMAAASPNWAALINAAYTSCKAVPVNVPANVPCKSGATQFKHCFNAYVSNNCPAGIKDTSARCTEILANAGKMGRNKAQRSG